MSIHWETKCQRVGMPIHLTIIFPTTRKFFRIREKTMRVNRIYRGKLNNLLATITENRLLLNWHVN